MSPAMAAAAAITGHLTDVRKFMSKASAQTTGRTRDPAQIKTLNALDFLTDPVLPSPKPIRPAQITPASAAPATSTEASSKALTFTTVKGIAAPLEIENVDTDMIIPKQFLHTIKRTGLANALFWTLRVDPYTGKKTDFVLNRAPYDQAKILVTIGQNFGCGSSREHAAWSLKDFGIQCVIAPSFGDIFQNNTMKNGMLPVVLPLEQCKQLHALAKEGKELEVDLEKQEVRLPDGSTMSFTVNSFPRYCLLNGLDDIGLTLQKADSISKFEGKRSAVWPWLDGVGYVQNGGEVRVGGNGGNKMDW